MEGNQMKMREALERTDLFLSALGKWLKVNDEGQEYALAAGVIHTLVEHALALPRRNCDVGTAEEQGERCIAQFDQWRRKGDGRKLITAIMAWAQMPYEQEGGAK